MLASRALLRFSRALASSGDSYSGAWTHQRGCCASSGLVQAHTLQPDSPHAPAPHPRWPRAVCSPPPAVPTSSVPPCLPCASPPPRPPPAPVRAASACRNPEPMAVHIHWCLVHRDAFSQAWAAHNPSYPYLPHPIPSHLLPPPPNLLSTPAVLYKRCPHLRVLPPLPPSPSLRSRPSCPGLAAHAFRAFLPAPRSPLPPLPRSPPLPDAAAKPTSQGRRMLVDVLGVCRGVRLLLGGAGVGGATARGRGRGRTGRGRTQPPPA